MKIPKSFSLMGHRIDVMFYPELVNRRDATGEAHYRFNQIIMQGVDGYPSRPESKIEHDFLHELVHFVLFYGECADTKELYKNEMVVDRIASMLHQALTTMEYDNGP